MILLLTFTVFSAFGPNLGFPMAFLQDQSTRNKLRIRVSTNSQVVSKVHAESITPSAQDKDTLKPQTLAVNNLFSPNVSQSRILQSLPFRKEKRTSAPKPTGAVCARLCAWAWRGADGAMHYSLPSPLTLGVLLSDPVATELARCETTLSQGGALRSP